MTECHYPPLSHSPRAGPELFSHWLVFLYHEKPIANTLVLCFQLISLGNLLGCGITRSKGMNCFMVLLDIKLTDLPL